MASRKRNRQHEPAAFDARRIVLIGLGMLVAVALLSAVLLIVIGHPHSAQRNAAFQNDEAIRPPRLQQAPLDDYATYIDDKQALLSSYAWIDRAGGKVRIPIDRAMDIVAARQQQTERGR